MIRIANIQQISKHRRKVKFIVFNEFEMTNDEKERERDRDGERER